MTAVKFQLMPPLSPDEYNALHESIRLHGIKTPVLVDEDGVMIDGHHRQKIAQELGIDCPEQVEHGLTDEEKRTLALTLNLDRRHLNREQKRALIAESVKADPKLSNREHARRTGVDDKTVGAVRTELESTAEIPQSETRVSGDGRVRPATQPASKPKAKTAREKEERRVGQVLALINDLRGPWSKGMCRSAEQMTKKERGFVIEALRDVLDRLEDMDNE